MRLGHVALVCRSEPAAARFYGEFLKLTLRDTKTAPAALSRQLFGVDAEIPIANYVGDGIHFEVFFRDDPKDAPGRIAHVCIEVAEPEALFERARAMGVTVLRAPRGDRWVTFVQDEDGNRFEVKRA